ncbi:MAG: hypothetical protein AAFQ22_06310 [Pseudomonadota bacterium]
MTEWILTGLTLAAFVALGVFANHKAGEVWDDPRPRLISWKFVMIVAAFGAFLTVVFALNQAGIETGRENGMFGR